MSFKTKFQQMADESYNKSNSNYDYYLDLQKYDLERFKFGKDQEDYLVDILPYTIATKKHPDFGKQEKTYHLEIFIHSFIGIRKGSYLCMEKMYKKPCRICETFKRKKEELENKGFSNKELWEEIKELAYKHRVLYYILYKNKIYVFDSPYTSFEKTWKSAIARKALKGIDIFPVYLNEDGCTSLEFTYVPKGQNFFDLINFDFPMIKDYNPEYVKNLISLEELLIIPDDEVIKDSLLGLNYDDEEDGNVEKGVESDHDYYKEVIEKEEVKEEIQAPAKKKKKAVENECPYGTQFGKDWDEYEHCDKCVNEYSEVYESCKKTYKENK